MKIIIQAGGVGSRLKFLTKAKPKGLVSAKYLPLIFHLFKKYPKDEFIIIGDYKFDVLDRYLATFAKDVNYILLKSQLKGNAAGIRSAVSLIPSGEPFMLIWSDLILSENFQVHEIRTGCQVGIADFPCSWSFQDGKLIHKSTPGHGVGGLFIFNDTKWFDDFPEGGSFTDWLAGKDMPLHPISLMGSLDVGTLDAYEKISPSANRCRPYNKIEFIDGKVVKVGLTPEAKAFIDREIVWYDKINAFGFNSAPEIFSRSPLTMEYIRGKNVFLSASHIEDKKVLLENIVTSLIKLHQYEENNSSAFDIYNEYFKKTIHRLQSIAFAIPFSENKIITINGVKCYNILAYPHLLRESVLNTLINEIRYRPIHGDCQLTNTMVDETGKIFFIDPRGYFGKSQVLGDVRYDWAKLYYSIRGNFDQFNIKNFDLTISDDGVEFNIHSGGWETLTDYFLQLLPQGESSPKELLLIHAIIWLSMASHAWEDFDSMCVAFYNGTLLFHEWQKEFDNA